MTRIKISGKDIFPLDVVVKMSEGNMGAINILMNMIKKLGDEAAFKMLSLDDMNIRGEQIWLGFKDHCNQDLDKFIECIEKRDFKMIATININCTNHVAVENGGSWAHTKG